MADTPSRVALVATFHHLCTAIIAAVDAGKLDDVTQIFIAEEHRPNMDIKAILDRMPKEHSAQIFQLVQDGNAEQILRLLDQKSTTTPPWDRRDVMGLLVFMAQDYARTMSAAIEGVITALADPSLAPVTLLHFKNTWPDWAQPGKIVRLKTPINAFVATGDRMRVLGFQGDHQEKLLLGCTITLNNNTTSVSATWAEGVRPDCTALLRYRHLHEIEADTPEPGSTRDERH